MNWVVENIINEFAADAAFNALVGDQVFWEMAPAGDDECFCNISVLENKPVSKDARDFTIEMRIYDNTLTRGGDVYEAARAVVQQKSGWNFISGRSQYTDQEGKQAYLELNFNYKNR